MLYSGHAYAGGGSFNVPQVNDHFDQVKPGPTPVKESLVTKSQSSGDKPGMWNSFKNACSNAWNSFKNGVATAWNWTKEKATQTWNWIKATVTRITMATVITLAFVFGLYMRFQRAVNNAIINFGKTLLNWGRTGLEKTYNYGKSIADPPVDNSTPYGTLDELKVSDQQLAQASQLAYLDNLVVGDKATQQLIDQRMKSGWVLDSRKTDLPNGLQAYVFRNASTKEIIIAFRGTEFPEHLKTHDLAEGARDLLIGDGPIALGNDTLNAQAIDAHKFVEKQLHNKLYRGYKFVLTGHSLGGYLALDNAARYRIPAVTFNAPGKDLYPNLNASVLFGWVGPGISHAVNMLDPENRKEAVNEKMGNYDKLIRNYRYDHDLVGSLGYHPGKTYEISDNGKVTEDKGLDNQLGLNFGSHGIKNFTGYDDEGNAVETPILKDYDEKGNIVKRN
ncbi:hypothetical protein [Thermoactinomyces sp. CICC 10522]|uniref:hypothetical protein n=1 Tax=Thermoactinomyces sp. CICC 10522 TaxID=2767427 RepID=UPI0018DE915F|nr:hypothetical protein [Thermoactinomyces sp. CICC 10522]MBH8605690.1 hypothetical protein [Thermoactinomyces sp. CICC 10522]